MRLSLLLCLQLVGLHLSTQDLVTTAPALYSQDDLNDENFNEPAITYDQGDGQPIVRSLHVVTDIQYRYATTLVTSKVVNPSNQSAQHMFSMTLPEAAFISEFNMEVKGQMYKAEVMKRADATAVFNNAVDAGQCAACVTLNARDSNEFTVSVNIEAYGKVTFYLTYEQFLTRNLGLYSNVININPNQIVEDMSVLVNIEDAGNITNLEVPDIQETSSKLSEIDMMQNIQNFPNHMTEETPETFHMGCTLLENSDDPAKLKWVRNILDHKSGLNRIVAEDGDPQRGFVLIRDKQWDGNQTGNLHLLAIANPRGLRSLRDLTSAHLPLLKNIKREVYRVISNRYGIRKSQLRAFLVYRPEFYHLHVHFTYLHYQPPDIIVDNMHPLNSVIGNIQIISDYYQRTTLEFQVPEPMYYGIETCYDNRKNPLAKIQETSSNEKQVIWKLTPKLQQKRNINGISGEFVVKFDVGREENPQKILVDEGFFVHFFAPENLPKFRKHIVFVLDFSGSMEGQKLSQLREAMKTIAYDLDTTDFFSVVIFQSYVEVWSPKGTTQSQQLDRDFIIEASNENLDGMISYLMNFTDLGGTNIMGALRRGLQLVDVGADMWMNQSDEPQPIIFFLTDGMPNVGDSNTSVIVAKTQSLNTRKCPIFSLAFGYDADYDFLRKLSLSNAGFARLIYEAADAAVQLKHFYKTVASPLMSNVTFDYLPEQVLGHTSDFFPMYFQGSEIVVAGKINQDTVSDNTTIGELSGISANGMQKYPIIVDTVLKSRNRTGKLEKAWVYLTIQQLLDLADSLDEGPQKDQALSKALELSIKYSFVTPLTSLVVTMPNQTETTVNTRKVIPALGGSLNLAGPYKVSVYNVRWIHPFLGGSTSDNVTVSIQGHQFILGLTKDDLSFGTCYVNNKAGECRHLNHCALTVFQNYVSAFIPYQCSIPGEYLGVCCPKE